MWAEFDQLADEYRNLHQKNISITGESPEYFSEYKVSDLLQLILPKRNLRNLKILDFGCGIGNSIPYFRKYFAFSELFCADVSSRSIEVAKSRFPGKENFLQIENNVPLPEGYLDVVFTACVFHHIPEKEHLRWLKELLRVTKPGGTLAIYEHNPLNPLSVHAFRTCPLDINARLLRANVIRKNTFLSGWGDPSINYKIFFPSILAKLRFLERYLDWLPLGAQYRLVAYK